MLLLRVVCSSLVFHFCVDITFGSIWKDGVSVGASPIDEVNCVGVIVRSRGKIRKGVIARRNQTNKKGSDESFQYEVAP